VTDDAGNKAKERTRKVNVDVTTDITPPVLYLLGSNPMSVYQGDAYDEPGAYAVDFPGNDTIPNDSIQKQGGVLTNIVGQYVITYIARDKAGNTADTTRTVNVIQKIGPDTIAPVVTVKLPNPVNIGVGYPYTEYGATALDNVDGDLTSQIKRTYHDSVLNVLPWVDTTKAGKYYVKYTVSDKAGNQGTGTRTVNVAGSQDNIPPVITLKGSNPMGVQLHKPYIEPGATATDNVDGNVSSKIVITGLVDTSKVGAYFRTYTVSDKAGNKAELRRTVNVVGTLDTVKPVITLNGSNPMSVEIHKAYVEPGATARDNVDGTITTKIVKTGRVDTSRVGANTITYTVSDNSGNTAVARRTVNVVTSLIPEWKVNTAYAVGDLVMYQSKKYKCVQAHTSQTAWTPANSPTIWQLQAIRQ
jgi:hypothetical protein